MLTFKEWHVCGIPQGFLQVDCRHFPSQVRCGGWWLHLSTKASAHVNRSQIIHNTIRLDDKILSSPMKIPLPIKCVVSPLRYWPQGSVRTIWTHLWRTTRYLCSWWRWRYLKGVVRCLSVKGRMKSKIGRSRDVNKLLDTVNDVSALMQAPMI